MEFMDDDGEHIKSKYLISHVNHFVLQTSNFLTQFVMDCEEKLVHFNRKIHQLESKITLLETNLGKDIVNDHFYLNLNIINLFDFIWS